MQPSCFAVVSWEGSWDGLQSHCWHCQRRSILPRRRTVFFIFYTPSCFTISSVNCLRSALICFLLKFQKLMQVYTCIVRICNGFRVLPITHQHQTSACGMCLKRFSILVPCEFWVSALHAFSNRRATRETKSCCPHKGMNPTRAMLSIWLWNKSLEVPRWEIYLQTVSITKWLWKN